jgi:hypothetical protein
MEVISFSGIVEFVRADVFWDPKEAEIATSLVE